MEDDIKFEDTHTLTYGNDKLTFKDIILSFLNKISHFASCEFRGGYWETRPSTNPNSSVDYKVYIPDTREIYSNAIECLADMLAPYFDKEMREVEQKTIEEDEAAFKNNTIIKQLDREDENPEQAAQYERTFKDITNRISYRSERVKIKRKLFRALCCFLYRKRYLDIGSIED